jgi:hypothetical protein
MKIAMLLALMGSCFVYADSSCEKLSAYVGTYRLINKTCSGPFGDQLVVQESEDEDMSGYILSTGGVGIGPVTSDESVDRCTKVKDGLIVNTCVSDPHCMPQGWIYSFSGARLSFQANGCVAQFQRLKDI